MAGNTSQMVSTLEGIFTADPCIDLCLPDGKATIFIKGRLRQISLSSNAFRFESSGGTWDNHKPSDLGSQCAIFCSRSPPKSLRSTGMLGKMASVTRKGFLVCGDQRHWGLKNPLIAQLPDTGYTLASSRYIRSSMVCLR